MGRAGTMTAGNKRWVRVAVDILHHPVIGAGRRVKAANAQRGAHSRCEAWLDLVASAAWKRHSYDNRGHTVMLERGQMPASVEFLANRWNWSIKTTRTFLNRLQSEGMTTMGMSSGRLAKILTICNYEAYQTSALPRGQVRRQVAGRLRAGCGQHSKKGHTGIGEDSGGPTAPPESSRATAPLRSPNGGDAAADALGEKKTTERPAVMHADDVQRFDATSDEFLTWLATADLDLAELAVKRGWTKLRPSEVAGLTAADVSRGRDVFKHLSDEAVAAAVITPPLPIAASAALVLQQVEVAP
jgi:hypothetical protein